MCVEGSRNRRNGLAFKLTLLGLKEYEQWEFFFWGVVVVVVTKEEKANAWVYIY
jgi:hypothetical protein